MANAQNLYYQTCASEGIFGVVIIGLTLCKRLTKVHLAEYLSEVQVCDATDDAMKYDSW